MNQIQEIDNFLALVANLAFYNPNYEITENFVYSLLAKKGDQVLDKHEPLISCFENLKGLNPNYHKQFGKNFLILHNGTLKPQECYKIYIPFKLEEFTTCNEMLFKYISNNNIIHQSKIASYIRSDSTVIRVNSFDDAINIINYVNTNDFLVNNIQEVNPFLFKVGKVGLTKDNYNSYNSIVANEVSKYINILKANKDLDNTSISSFSTFINNEINICKDINTIRILNLISFNLNSNKSLSGFIAYAEKPFKEQQNTSTKFKSTQEEALEQAVLKTYEKYDFNQVVSAIKQYSYGNPRLFTNTDMVRKTLIRNVEPNNIMSLINQILYDTPNYDNKNQDELIKQYLAYLNIGFSVKL